MSTPKHKPIAITGGTNAKSKVRKEQPKGEFGRFQDLMRGLLDVPKTELDEKRKSESGS